MCLPVQNTGKAKKNITLKLPVKIYGWSTMSMPFNSRATFLYGVVLPYTVSDIVIIIKSQFSKA